MPVTIDLQPAPERTPVASGRHDGEAVAIVHKLTKRFAPDAPPALDAISFSIKSGQVTGVAGPDGAGKTTLMRLMAGLLRPDRRQPHGVRL